MRWIDASEVTLRQAGARSPSKLQGIAAFWTTKLWRRTDGGPYRFQWRNAPFLWWKTTTAKIADSKV